MMLPGANAAEVQVPMSQLAKDLHNQVNQYRESKALPPLELHELISAEAQTHSLNMATLKSSFGHDGFEERVRLISNKLGPVYKSAENVAFGKFDAKEVLEVWLKSQGHRRNIEGKYTHTGIGISKDHKGIIFFTQIFIVR